MGHVCAPFAACVVVAAGCIAPPVEAPKTTVEEENHYESVQAVKDEVDLLFLVDDSQSMAPKQEALKARFPDLINQLDAFAMGGQKASYHIGVVTSDLGAPGIGCGSNLGGKLQQRGLAKTNAAGCQGPVGKSYIEYDQRTGADNFSSTGQSLAQTFACMASVVDPEGTPAGHYGCGFEAQLEAVYRALHDPIPENVGFLRPGAILAVVWITDEDDCSVDPTSDLFAVDPSLGPLNSYRCARYGLFCDGALLPPEPRASFASCAPATAAQGGKLSDVEKYVRFFTLPRTKGGVKANPKDVILAAIAAPKDPVSSVLASGLGCGPGVTSCTNIAHACVAPDDAAFFGDPAQRLGAVVERAPHHLLTSICDKDYKSALLGIGELINDTLEPACLTAPIADVTHPDCVVEDLGADGQRTSIPFCVEGSAARPCWRLCNAADGAARNAGCGEAALGALRKHCMPVCNPRDGRFQIVGLDIDRGGVMAAAGTTAEIACATIAIANEDPNAACAMP